MDKVIDKTDWSVAMKECHTQDVDIKCKKCETKFTVKQSGEWYLKKKQLAKNVKLVLGVCPSCFRQTIVPFIDPNYLSK